MNGTSGQFSGVVDYINVKGDQQGSAQLLFGLRAANGDALAGCLIEIAMA
jgi:hypothetical protein